ncbi:hypothetical protein [Nocardioides zeae]|uniref:Uncharacterized protein n=1 Tax=Nocardioides zeae TaxID=1457234 RepID=A0A6P0HHB5_9ACTN|nr:hypothetical protein [Nocardioides zeae]NEN77674.1 hypothetical protein [Nocardioides zeae]
MGVVFWPVWAAIVVVGIVCLLLVGLTLLGGSRSAGLTAARLPLLGAAATGLGAAIPLAVARSGAEGGAGLLIACVTTAAVVAAFVGLAVAQANRAPGGA